MTPVSSRWISLLVLPFVVWASIASIDAYVLCMGDGHGHQATVEPIHSHSAVCHGHHGHHDHHGQHAHGQADGSMPEFRHNHLGHRDIPLKLNQGHIKNKERLQAAWSSETSPVEDLSGIASPPLVSYPIRDLSLRHLQSVVLLI